MFLDAKFSLIHKIWEILHETQCTDGLIATLVVEVIDECVGGGGGDVEVDGDVDVGDKLDDDDNPISLKANFKALSKLGWLFDSCIWFSSWN